MAGAARWVGQESSAMVCFGCPGGASSRCRSPRGRQASRVPRLENGAQRVVRTMVHLVLQPKRVTLVHPPRGLEPVCTPIARMRPKSHGLRSSLPLAMIPQPATRVSRPQALWKRLYVACT
uniref:cDNA FLJ43766 fis, clone TESTI2049246 n=1 Tax=Homo sapiens TaxID=9606 RepID=Q6ZUF0_HUMAN|nr:unnamed protein product [Homo sapiens]